MLKIVVQEYKMEYKFALLTIFGILSTSLVAYSYKEYLRSKKHVKKDDTLTKAEKPVISFETEEGSLQVEM